MPLKETRGDNDFHSEFLTVFPGGAQNVRRATKTSLKGEAPRYQIETSLGEHCTVLSYYASLSQNSSPYKQAYQILANPCYFYLGESISPERLLGLSEDNIVKLPSEDKCEVYLLKNFIDHPSKPEFLLYFSPSNDDRLVKCTRRDQQNFSKTIYVSKWNKISETLVASKIHRINEGSSEEILTISSPRINNIDDDLFDTAKLPEFNNKWDAVLDYEKFSLGDPNWITHHESPVEIPAKTSN